MRNIFLLLGFLAILSISCINTEKENNTDKKQQDSFIEQSDSYETYFETNLLIEHHKDDIAVKWYLFERDLLIIYYSKRAMNDSAHIINVNGINSYEWFECYFGIDVTLGCGTGCSIQEYHLFKAENDTLYEVLVFRSNDYFQEASRPVRRDDNGDYVINQHEYVAEFVNISSIDNTATIFELQREDYHDYSKVPDNFSQLYSLKWDSLNHVFCNTYMDICGEYHCQFRDDSSTEKDIVFQEKNIPAFKNTRYTYVYINNIWAILLSSNELLFTQML